MDELLFNRDRLEQIKVPFDNLCRYLQAKQIKGVYHVHTRDDQGRRTVFTSLIVKHDALDYMNLVITRWPHYPLILPTKTQNLLKRPLEKGVSRKLKLTPETSWGDQQILPPSLGAWINWVFAHACYYKAYWGREHDACLLNTETQQMVFAQHKRVLSRTVEYLIKPEEPAPPARTVLPRPIRKVRK